MADPSTKETFRRLIGYTKPYRGKLFLGLFFGIIFGGGTGGLVVALEPTLQRIFSTNSLSVKQIATIACLLPLAALVRGVGDYLSKYYVEWVGHRVVMDLRCDTFKRLMDLPVLYFTKSRTGDLITRTVSDTMLVERSVSTVLGDLAKQPFVLMAMMGILLWKNWQLAVVSLVVFPICIIPVALFGRKVRRYTRQGQERLGDMISIFQESVSGIRIVKAFGMESYEKSRFSDRCADVFNRAVSVTKARASVEPIITVVAMVGLALVLVYSHYFQMEWTRFITFGVALMALYDPVKKLSKIHLTLQQSTAAADRVFEIIDAESNVHDSPSAEPLTDRIHSIEFENVSFRYEDNWILRNINLKVSEGDCLALVGSSGSGKTTLVNMLPRFFDPTEGRILINGRDVREYTIASLRGKMAMVTQDVILFNDSVEKNIAYGLEAPAFAEVEQAARLSHADEFIQEMEEGYKTEIGERGLRLSGGQAQRLSLARAMMRNPPVMILDEATSALDTESERYVQAALDELMENRTVFAIAHRLSTIKHADRIIVLGQGQIEESGTHDELIDRSGTYRYLYDLQFNS